MFRVRRVSAHTRARSLGVIASAVGVALVTGGMLMHADASADPYLPPAGGYFAMAAPGSGFPTEAECAQRVHRSAWEPRAQNTTANRNVPAQPVALANHPSFTAAWQSNYKTRITGNFSGTTDEIIQWAACKWGWSDEIVRAQGVNETNWVQSAAGDVESSSRGHCTPDYTGSTCPTSFGFLQLKWYYNPSTNLVGNSYPLSAKSTAFSLDYSLAHMRGCYDGMSSYLGNTKGDMWGCLGAWFSGGWHDADAEAYIARIKNFLNQKAWLGWADQSGLVPTTPATTTPPTTTVPTTKAPTTTTVPKSTTTVALPSSTTTVPKTTTTAKPVTTTTVKPATTTTVEPGKCNSRSRGRKACTQRSG